MIAEAEHWRTTDSKGVTMPWYTRHCCQYLDSMDLKGKKVWEYGGGVSTLWYRSRGAEVKGVDIDPYWAKLANIGCQKEEGMYLVSIQLTKEKFDIICIDGHFRDKCLYVSLNSLNDDGIIIIDNWKQESAGWPNWSFTEQVIEEENLKMQKFPEPNHPDWVTIILSR